MVSTMPPNKAMSTSSGCPPPRKQPSPRPTPGLGPRTLPPAAEFRNVIGEGTGNPCRVSPAELGGARQGRKPETKWAVAGSVIRRFVVWSAGFAAPDDPAGALRPASTARRSKRRILEGEVIPLSPMLIFLRNRKGGAAPPMRRATPVRYVLLLQQPSRREASPRSLELTIKFDHSEKRGVDAGSKMRSDPFRCVRRSIPGNRCGCQPISTRRIMFQTCSSSGAGWLQSMDAATARWPNGVQRGMGALVAPYS